MKRASNLISAVLGLALLVALAIGIAAVLRGVSFIADSPGVSPLVSVIVLLSPLHMPTPDNTPLLVNTRAPVYTPTLVPTATPMVVPPPPGWPTDQPWPPPTRSPQEMWPTSIPIVFPTPAFQSPPQGTRPNTLSSIWYPYFPDSNSKPQLRAVEVDAQGQRWGESNRSLELKLSSPATDIDPGPILIGLHPSPDSHWLVADFAYVGAQLVDLSTGKVQPLATNIAIDRWHFIAWSPDSQQIIIIADKGILLVDLVSQTYKTIEFPQEKYGPYVRAIAYSPDGNQIADVLEYPAVFGGREIEMTEIGLRNGENGHRESIIQIPGQQTLDHSLQWSADGQKLIWTGISAPQESSITAVTNIQVQLWLADLTKKDVRAIETLGEAVEYSHQPVLSPDGHFIAFIKVEGINDSKDVSNNIHLFDLQSGLKRQLTNFTDRRLSNVTWSPNGKYLAFAVAKGDYSEIWLTDVNGAQQYPVAGPASREAPIVWLPSQ